MRLCFVIVCMAGIGVGLVHLRRRQDIARHELLNFGREHNRLRRIAHQQESDGGYLTSPKSIAESARRMNIDLDPKPVRLAGPTDQPGRGNNNRTTN